MSYLALVVKSVVYPTLLVFVLVAGLAIYVQLFVGTEPATTADWNATKHVNLNGLTFATVETSTGVRLNVIEAGDRNASKLVVLLHGFPETALLSWHTLIPVLVAEGYFVVAPDQRGYNQSSKPEAVADYTLDALAGDVRDLIQHYNRTRAVIIGHDWGAAVTWWMGQRHPDLVEKLVVMNVPHNHAFREHLRASWSQLAKSWYIFYFQLPFVPEFKLASNNYSFLQGIPARSGVQGKTFPLDSAPRYLQAWSEPGALSGMLNWYRAAIRYGRHVSQGVDPTIRVPTHVIWGKQDIALEAEMVEKSLAFCAPGMCQATYVDQATHWVQHDEPEAVAHTITTFLKQ